MSAPESVLRTLATAGGVALFCSLMVSSAVYWLRPIQLAHTSVGQHRAVLIAAGLVENDVNLTERELGSRFLQLEPRLVDLDAARFMTADASMVASYDYRAAMDDPDRSRSIAPEKDVASLGRRPSLMPVYLLRDGGDLERIVLAVYGRGMWSTIHGYIALGSDLTTIADIWFYEHGETPGIGDRIQSPAWRRQWRGKLAYGTGATVALRIGGDDAPESSRIDSITGATVTATAVGRFVRYWLGEDGYGPFLANLRSEGS